MRTGATTEMTITLYLIRHGATASNKRHAYLGKTDEPLSNEGGAQILSYKDAGIYPAPCNDLLIFSSPLLRCLQTKDLLYPDNLAILIPEWTEMDFGRFEGKNYQELNGDPDYQRWIDSGGTIAFPEGESREEFIARSMAGFEWCIKCMTGKIQKSAVCIVHGGTIMAILSSLTDGNYYDYQVKNGQGYKLELSLDKDDHVQVTRITPLIQEKMNKQ
jgi:alpha-ribazole phosphatase